MCAGTLRVWDTNLRRDPILGNRICSISGAVGVNSIVVGRAMSQMMGFVILERNSPVSPEREC